MFVSFLRLCATFSSALQHPHSLNSRGSPVWLSRIFWTRVLRYFIIPQSANINMLLQSWHFSLSDALAECGAQSAARQYLSYYGASKNKNILWALRKTMQTGYSNVCIVRRRHKPACQSLDSVAFMVLQVTGECTCHKRYNARMTPYRGSCIVRDLLVHVPNMRAMQMQCKGYRN